MFHSLLLGAIVGGPVNGIRPSNAAPKCCNIVGTCRQKPNAVHQRNSDSYGFCKMVDIV